MLPTKVAVEKSMRLSPAFFVLLLTIPATALACIGSIEPGFDRMIKDSTLIVRGEVLRESGDNEWNKGEKQHASDVLVDRAYRGTASNVIRVSWKEYFGCPRARLDQKDYGLFFLRASGSEFVLVDEQYGRLAVSRWQDDSRGLDPFIAIERDFKRAIRNDSGRQLL